MKLYYYTTKRIAKKKSSFWHKLNQAKFLKIGDIFSTCLGYNSIITEISPEYSNRGLSKGFVLCDCQIFGKNICCSLCHCITLPTWSGEDVVNRWLAYDTPKTIEMWKNFEMESSLKIIELMRKGHDVFDEKGCLIRDLSNEN